MAGNPFDQFDSVQTATSNPFNQFDASIVSQVPLDYSNLTEGMTDTQKVIAGVGKGMTDVATGVKQRGMELGNMMGIVPDASLKSYSDQIAQNRAIDAPLMNTTPGKIGNFIGEVAPTVTMPGGVAGGFLRRMGTSALAGGAVGAMQPTTENDSLLANTGIGAASGGAASGVLSGIGKGYNALMDRLPPNITEALAKRYGIRTTLGEATGNPLIHRGETWMERIPVIGLKGFREAQHKEADTAAKGLLGKYIIDPASPDVMKSNRQYASGLYNTLREKIDDIDTQVIYPRETRDVAVDLLERYPDIFKKFQDTKREKIIAGIASDTKNVTQNPNAIADTPLTAPVFKKFDQPKTDLGTMTFDEAWTLRQGLGEMIGQARKKLAAGDVDRTTVAELSRLYGAVNRDIDGWTAAVGRPDVKEAITAANDAYKHYVVKYDIIQRAYDKAAGVSSAKEMFSPKTFSTELKKIAYKDQAMGKFSAQEIDEMSGLANVLQVVKRAGQYMENPPTGDRWGVPILGMGTAAMSAKTAAVGGGVIGITRFLTGTTAGKKLALAASKIEPTNPNMKVLIKLMYNQLPKMASSGVTGDF